MRTAMLLLLVSVVIVSSCSISQTFPLGSVSFPKEPEASRPVNFSFCESDEDCTTTTFEADTCCTFCPHAVNKVGQNYLEEWDRLNCQKTNSRKDCWTFECSGISKVSCQNNSCAAIFRN